MTVPYFSRGEDPFGTTWESWCTKWWTWLLGIPLATNPANDPVGTNQIQNQTNANATFIAGVATKDPSKSTAVRAITVPSSKGIFFPLINDIQTELEKRKTASTGAIDLPGLASDDADHMISLELTIDKGMSTEVSLLTGVLSTYRVKTSDAGEPTFQVPIVAKDIFDLNAGPDTINTDAASDGHWFFIKKDVWNPGSQHTIHFRGVEDDYLNDVTYNLTLT
jgi:hypothetical protein